MCQWYTPKTIVTFAYTYYSFSVMMKCWTLSPEDRPTFKELTSIIDKELQRAAGYLDLNMVLLPPANDEESDSD